MFRFAEFTLDPSERQLLRNGALIPLAPKAFDLLVALVREAGRLVTKDQLLTRVWPDVSVEEGIISVHISALRKALGDAASCIETVPRLGYRFAAPVVTRSSPVATTGNGVPRPIEVHQLVGHGRANLLSGSSAVLPAAIESFRAAIDIDSEYAPAHAGLALARCARASVHAAPHREEYAEAKVSALRALALDPNSADAQVALGTVLFLSEWAWSDAERSFRRALDVNPAHTEGLLQYGSLLEALGQFDVSLHLKHRALERDSPSTLVLVQIAMSYWHQRRYEETRAWAQRALDVDPRHDLASECLTSVYWKLGDIDGFIEEGARRAAAVGAPEDVVAGFRRAGEPMKRAYAQTGAAGLARLLLQAMAARPRDAARSPAVQLAVFCGAAGYLDDAFTHLDTAIQSRDPALVHLSVAPQWDTLRHDPRFAERLHLLRLSAPST